MVDIARFDRALAVIEAHPELHEQGSWLVRLSCGTGGCLAGHVLLQEYPDGEPAVFLEALRGTAGIGVVTFDGFRLASGEVVDVEYHAAKLLGLHPGQRDMVFSPQNNAEGLRAMRDALAANPGITSHELFRLMPYDADDGDEYGCDDGDDGE